MSEVKTVKVDNWGSFFLQKLQNFFNKTDYCDLTLQFRDNSQLKVHRLVLSACTDYFNILETTVNCTDDILLMPRDLQADVVVPIVNFMYTGTLEFEVRMYERLLKTARDMKMSVLLKLLEAHRRAIPAKPAPILLNRGVAGRPAMRGGGYQPPSTRGGRTIAGRTAFVSRFSTNKAGQLEMEEMEEEPATGGSDFERLRRAGNENPNKRPLAVAPRSASPPEKKPNLQDVKDFTEAARLRKQLMSEGGDEADTSALADYDVDDSYSQSSGEETTPRQSVSLLSTASNKSSARNSLETATVTLQEQPGTKMDHAKIIGEVMKKYPHLLKSNKNIKLKITQKSAGTAGTSFTVRAEDSASPSPAGTSLVVPNKSSAATTPLGRALLASKEKQMSATATTISTTPTAAGQRVMLRTGASLITKPSIISKPNIIANKVVAAGSSPTAAAASVATASSSHVKANRIDSKTMHKLIAMGAENQEGPWLCLRCGVDGKPIGIPSYRAFRKHLINTHHEKIDPRLCEHCGHRSKNRHDLYHHIQVKHDILPPQGVVFPVCKVCKHVALDKLQLVLHEKDTGHSQGPVSSTTTTTNKTAASMTRSKQAAAAAASTTTTAAKDSSEHSCEQCDKHFPTLKALSMHRVAKHRGTRPRGRPPKVVESETEEEEEEDEDEEEEDEDDEEQEIDFDSALVDDVDYVPSKPLDKVKILSNVTMKTKSRSSEAESLSNVATGIATSLGLGDEEEVGESAAVGGNSSAEFEEEEVIVDETRFIEEAMANVHGEKAGDGGDEVVTKFLAEDGSELQLTAAQKEELMSQLESATTANGASGRDVVMVYEQTEEQTVTTSEQIITDGEEVLMVYGGPRTKAARGARSKPAEEETADDSVDGVKVDEAICKTEVTEEKVQDEKNKLIKELEGDWADDGEGKEAEGGDEQPVPDDASKVDEPETEEPIEEEKKKPEEKGDAEEIKAEPEEVKTEIESPTKMDSEAAENGSSSVSEAPGKKDSAAPEAIAAAFMNDWDDEEN